MNGAALEIIGALCDNLQKERDEEKRLIKELEAVKESLKAREDDAMYWYRKYNEVCPPEEPCQPKKAEEIKEVLPF